MALKNINLSIEYGKKIALVGNNGAGKSTLFLLLNGIIKPTNGKVLYKGRKLFYNPEGCSRAPTTGWNCLSKSRLSAFFFKCL